MRVCLLLLCLLLIAAPLAVAQDSTVVDPDHYKVVLENDHVRVVKIAYGPGEESVMHSHPAGPVIFHTDIKSEMTLPDGSTMMMEAKAGDVAWSPGGRHQPVNLSDEPLVVYQVELKGAAGGGEPSEGQWTNALPAPETTDLGGGRTMQKYVYKQAGLASVAGPFGNQGQDCAGMTIVDGDGAVLAGDGHCRSVSADGASGAAYWWRIDAAGTEDCPILCGSYGYYAGFGEWEGISGGGTWKTIHTAPNGVGIGTWKGSHSVPD